MSRYSQYSASSARRGRTAALITAYSLAASLGVSLQGCDPDQTKREPQGKKLVSETAKSENGKNYSFEVWGEDEVPKGQTGTYTMRIVTEDGVIHRAIASVGISPKEKGRFGQTESYKMLLGQKEFVDIGSRPANRFAVLNKDARYKEAEEGVKAIQEKIEEPVRKAVKSFEVVGFRPGDYDRFLDTYFWGVEPAKPFWSDNTGTIRITSSDQDGFEVRGWKAVEHRIPIDVLGDFELTFCGYTEPEPKPEHRRKFLKTVKIKAKEEERIKMRERKPEKNSGVETRRKEEAHGTVDSDLLKTYTGKTDAGESVRLDIYKTKAVLRLDSGKGGFTAVDNGPDGDFDSLTSSDDKTLDLAACRAQGGHPGRKAALVSQALSYKLHNEVFGVPFPVILHRVFGDETGKPESWEFVDEAIDKHKRLEGANGDLTKLRMGMESLFRR